MLNQYCLEHYHKSLPSCLILKQGMKRPIEPLKSFLNSSKLLENLSPSIILSSPTLPELRSILTIPPSPPLIPFSPSSFFPTLSWKEIHHPHYPRKIQDLLWKISHFSLPVGPSVTNISPYSSFCPYCPLTSNSIRHLFSLCPITSSLQTLTSNLLSQTSSSSSFSYILSSNSISSNCKHVICLIFSSFIWTIWHHILLAHLVPPLLPPSLISTSLFIVTYFKINLSSLHLFGHQHLKLNLSSIQLFLLLSPLLLLYLSNWPFATFFVAPLFLWQESVVSC